MAAYKDRLTQDLDRWIAAGLAPAANREAMLATVPDARRLDAATALAWVGGLLLGIAAIAFVAANWDDLPRIARFIVILGAFALTACVGAWTAHKGRPIASDIALMVSALLFGAAIGLTGQIFDILGDPRAALYGGGLGALALAIAGRSTGAAIAALVFFGLGDFTALDLFSSNGVDAPWLIVAAPLGVFLALRWRSAPLAHAAALGVLFALGWFGGRYDDEGPLFLLFAMVLTGAAGAARWLGKEDRPHASVFYGWAALGAISFFAIAGYANDEARAGETLGIVHRLAWLAASGALIALGRYDRHALVTGIGVISLLIAIAALLMDLDVNLMTAAAIFFLCALAAIVGGLLLRRKPKAT
jgi:uncharacterized membrane protein